METSEEMDKFESGEVRTDKEVSPAPSPEVEETLDPEVELIEELIEEVEAE